MSVDVVAVPYRGLGPAMQDLIAGRIDYMSDDPSTSKPQLEGNFVKAITITGKQRSPSLPQIPTAHEQGLNFDVTAWQGLFLAKDTPEPIVRQLSAALNKALDLPTLRAALRSPRRRSRHARAPRPGIFPQVRRRGDRALERTDQGERRYRGVTRREPTGAL